MVAGRALNRLLVGLPSNRACRAGSPAWAQTLCHSSRCTDGRNAVGHVGKHQGCADSCPIGGGGRATSGATNGPIRAYCRHRCICITIPPKQNERRRGPFNRTLYRQRNRVERLMNRLKQFRRIATRYEKRAENYLAMLTIGAILLWL